MNAITFVVPESLIEEVLRLVDLSGQIRRSSFVRVVEHHHFPVELANLPGGSPWRYSEDERGLSLCHLTIEASFVVL